MNVFLRSYKAYSPAFFGKNELNKGNKSIKLSLLNGPMSIVILPSSALHELARLSISYPMIFMLSNPQMAKKTYVGVLEFSAEEGLCYLPYWVKRSASLINENR
jgi:ubiquitin fusion degradation protein 1